jgi:putative membrane protein
MKTLILSIGLLLQCYSGSAQKNDTTFVREAAQAGMLEVKLGELAVAKTSNSDVKMLGQHMITDHTKANNELKALVAKKNITLPTGLSSEGQMHYDDLSKLSGAEFDKAYCDLMVKDHEKVISKFKTESTGGKDMEFKNFATKTLPTLEHHLHMSKEAKMAVNK